MLFRLTSEQLDTKLPIDLVIWISFLLSFKIIVSTINVNNNLLSVENKFTL